jgi:hypothetical protein
MITESAAEIEDRRVVARRLFGALCAQHPDKYIALIQPRDVANELLPASEISRSKATASPEKTMTLEPRDH